MQTKNGITFVLQRHGHAEDKAKSGHDSDRVLDETGVVWVMKMQQKLLDLGLAPADLLLCSSALRTFQTIERDGRPIFILSELYIPQNPEVDVLFKKYGNTTLRIYKELAPKQFEAWSTRAHTAVMEVISNHELTSGIVRIGGHGMLNSALALALLGDKADKETKDELLDTVLGYGTCIVIDPAGTVQFLQP